jgi:Transcriptional regulator, AbiEi antitoxin, Type IV TA system/Transcriptional regulator, AbiEi antitoxin N-terminal domain
MNTTNASKIQNVLGKWPVAGLVNQTWLNQHNVSYSLANQYVKSGWLERVSPGVFKRPYDELTWQGALASLQTQSGLAIHVGGLTALTNDGLGQYARMGTEPLQLFGPKGTTLPKWFKAASWGSDIVHSQTSFLPTDLGIRQTNYEAFPIQSSAPERAILEALYLAPKTVSLLEAYDIMDGLRSLRPSLMLSLLQGCNSYKVKRLFAFMARKLDLPVIRELDFDSLDYGSGVRAIVKNGMYDARSQLMLPRELLERVE